jgi:hypothetical protein
LYQLRRGIHPKKRVENPVKTPDLRERIKEFAKYIPKPKINPKAVQQTNPNQKVLNRFEDMLLEE